MFCSDFYYIVTAFVKNICK